MIGLLAYASIAKVGNLPCFFEDDLPFVEVKIGNNKVWALVDTAAAKSELTSDDVGSESSQQEVVAKCGKFTFSLSKSSDPSIELASQRKVGAILGMDFLADKVVVIDYSRGLVDILSGGDSLEYIRLRKEAKESEHSRIVEQSLSRDKSGEILTTLTIQSQKVNAVLDTGSNDFSVPGIAVRASYSQLTSTADGQVAEPVCLAEVEHQGNRYFWPVVRTSDDVAVAGVPCLTNGLAVIDLVHKKLLYEPPTRSDRAEMLLSSVLGIKVKHGKLVSNRDGTGYEWKGIKQFSRAQLMKRAQELSPANVEEFRTWVTKVRPLSLLVQIAGKEVEFNRDASPTAEYLPPGAPLKNYFWMWIPGSGYAEIERPK